MGENIFAGILRRAGQPILVVREVLSWFTTAAIIENEKAEILRESLITLRIPTPVCVRIDEALAFQSLSQCSILNELGITIKTGRTKNPNKNAVVDKTINELEKEIKRLVFIERQINSSILSLAVGH